MLRKLIKKVTNLPALFKFATRKADVFTFANMGNVVRDEAHTAVKSILFKYVFLTNIIAGCIGFLLGLIVMMVWF